MGKTEIGKVLADTLHRRLVRLQCYEGLDLSSAVYSGTTPARCRDPHGRGGGGERPRGSPDITGALIRKACFRRCSPHRRGATVLLIDELDRTDEPFEAYLLEVLADFQVTIPRSARSRRAGRRSSSSSNRTREIHDALKRRCFYRGVDYPDAERELEDHPGAPAGCARAPVAQVVGFVQGLRGEDLFKLPGVAETLDWTQA